MDNPHPEKKPDLALRRDMGPRFEKKCIESKNREGDKSKRKKGLSAGGPKAPTEGK